MAPLSEPGVPEPEPCLRNVHAEAQQSASDEQIAEDAKKKCPISDTITPPILRIPTEIFAQIVTNVMQSRKERYKETVRKLILVCKAWRDIVINTPAVWSFIDYDDGQAYVRAALTNSRNHPLTIWQNAWDNSDHFLWFGEEIVKQSHRWLSLDLTTIPLPNYILRTIMEASAPILRSFRIRDINDNPGGSYWPTLFKGEPLPHLQHLKIRYFDIGLEPKSLTALEYLYIMLDYDETDTPQITPDIFAAVLRNNPKLSYVHLEGTVGAGLKSKAFRPNCSDPIDLPHLRSMDFIATRTAYVKAVKPFLVSPCKPNFEREISDEDDSEEDSAAEQ